MPRRSDNEVVRPTRRSLHELGIALPSIDQALHELDDPHLSAMQKVPERAMAGGVERILRIADRVWLKYKSGDVRAAVAKLKESEVARCVETFSHLGRWWIGTVGHRQKDSPQRDFYEQLPTSSEHLLPTDWDHDRLEAEMALQWRAEVKAVVRETIIRAIRTESESRATAANHYIRAIVTNGDEIYLTLGTGGVYNPAVIAVILDSVPGVSVDNWFIEPSGTLGIDCRSGEVVWSTLLPEGTLQELLEGAEHD